MAVQADVARKSVVQGEIVRRIDEIAGEMRQLVFGGEGVPEWGTTFTEIEDVGVQIGDALACKLLEQSVAQQAQSSQAEATTCGACGADLKEPAPHPHIVRSRRGEVSWSEPSGYCPRCRRAFFPSGQSVGD